MLALLLTLSLVGSHPSPATPPYSHAAPQASAAAAPWRPLQPQGHAPTIFRAQGPAPLYDETIQTLPPISAPMGGSPGAGFNPFGPSVVSPMVQDPFLASPGAISDPYLQQPWMGGAMTRPDRLGWTPKVGFGIIPSQGAGSPGQGKFEVLEYDLELVFREPWSGDFIFTSSPQFNARTWDGPEGDVVGLPGSVYRFGWDFGLETVNRGGWSWHAHFNPSINTDFNNGLSRNAFNFDAWAYGEFDLGPTAKFILGAGYWDRVDGIVVPYAGLVWQPSPQWELRLLYPESRVSRFLGNFWNETHWLYVNLAYHVEAYEIERTTGGTGFRDQVQLQDYRLTLGLRSDAAWYEKFIEVGYIFNRDIEFATGGRKFDVNDGFIARLGVKF